MPSSNINKNRVLLIAEDDHDILSCLIEYFELLEYKVYGVNSGELAYTVAQKIKPDLIVTDLIMPGLSGLSLLEKLNNISTGRSIPVIILSARVDAEARDRAFALGALDFVTKPFALARLREAVNAALSAI